LVTLYFNLTFSAAGYSIDVPEESTAAFAKSLAGFEDEIVKRIDEYYENHGI
jgi:hypothetical protein